ncbi:uncharacterized protein DUF11 [Arcicella aurantiaca]|uniref:Uncharacterized protein DUF11 n=1 Tax=Arcicella aurantiaca TaxID=591202 RepID=A0A316EH33_9BACT|nr:PKD-like domain-containing protein [Arcicella aurantiaca]PWK29074.1 uncharacterized protein DUF11 [Arcicella aurantiaca]
MKKIYLFLIGILTAWLGFSNTTLFDIVLFSRNLDNSIKNSKTEKPKAKSVARKIRKQVIPYAGTQALTPEENILYSTLLPPSITATKSVTGSAVPGGQLDYTIVVSNAGTDAANVVVTDPLVADLTLVAGSVKASPIAVEDSYDCIGNVGINVPTANGVLANDVNPVNTSMSTTAVNQAGTQGTVVMNPDGSFTFTPTVGFSGNTTFTYTISNTYFTRTATVTINVSAPIYFVNLAAATSGTGTLQSPFKDISNVTGTGSNAIFIYSNATAYSGSLTLENNQRVIGQGASASLATILGVTVPTFSNALPATGGTKPNLTSSGTTITLGSSNTLRGFDMGNSTKDIVGSSFGTLTASEIALNGNGQALDLTTGTLGATFVSISSTNSAADGIALTGVAGTLTIVGGTTITNPTSRGIGVLGASSVTANFGNTNITGSGGNGITTSGTTSNTSTLTFGDLDIAPDAGQTAMNVFTSNTISCTSGTITTSNTTGSVPGIFLEGGSSAAKANLNMVLDSYTTTGATGATIGLTLKNTSGSFNINGTGSTAGSGGSISGFSSRGANFENASNITLKNMNFTNANSLNDGTPNTSDNSNANGAIHAANVTGLTLDNLSFTGTIVHTGINLYKVTTFSLANSTITDPGDGGTNTLPSVEGGIHAIDLGGTCSISNTTIASPLSRCVLITQLGNTTPLTLNVSNSTFRDSYDGGNQGNDNMEINCFNSTVSTVNISGSSFLRSKTLQLQGLCNNTSQLTVNVQTSTFDNGSNPSGGIELSSNDNATLNFNILNNTLIKSSGQAGVYVGAKVNSTTQGRINGNTDIRSVGNCCSAIYADQDGDATMKVEVMNNTLTINSANNFDNVIFLRNVNGTTNSGSLNKMDAIISNNTMNVTGTQAFAGIHTVSGGSGGTKYNKTCAKINGNTVNGVVNPNYAHFAQENGAGTSTSVIYLERVTGSGTTAEAIWNNNSNSPVGTSTNIGTTGTVSVAPAACAVPSNSNAPIVNSVAISEKQVEGTIETPAVTKTETVLEETKEEAETAVTENETIATKTEAKPSTESTNANARMMAGETITVNGTGTGFSLPAGKNTTITFSATVSSTPSTCAITNQATVTYTGGSVNSNTTTTNLIVAPPTGVTGATSICNGQSISLSATCPNGTIQWYTTAAPSSLLGTGSPFSQSPTSNTTYTAKCLVGGCESAGTNSGLITVNALPVPAPSSNSPVCTGNALNLSSASSTSYSWSGPNGFTSSLRNPSISNVTIPAGGTYTITQTNSFNCTASATTAVTISQTPTATIGSNSPICEGQTINLTSGGGGTYSWTGPNSFTSSIQNPTITSATTAAAGTYIVTVTSSGCTATNSVVFTVNANPITTVSNDSPVCSGNTLNLITPTILGVTYSWAGPNNFTSSLQNPSIANVTTAAAGSYTITKTIVATGCSASANTTVMINSTPAPTAPTATPSSRSTTGSVTLSATGCSGGTLTWYNASTNVAVPSPNNQPNLTAQGTYNFYAKCTGTNTCVSDASTNVSVAVSLCTPLATSPGNVGINWTGLVSTDWNNACNWNPAWVPDATNSAVVIGLQTNQPTISGTVPNVKLIYVNSGATLTVASGGTLNASSTAGVITLQGGNLINDGTINVSGGGTSVGLAIGATASIMNRGTITTNNLYGASLQFGNLTFTNESTGIFNGDFKANNNVLTLTNHGTINYAGGTYALSLGSIGSSVINDGTISVTGGSGISNPSGSTIANNACGKILMTTGLYENGGTTTNTGLIQMPNLYDFTNTGTFTNNGVLKANTVSSVTNNKMVITNACPIFTLGGTNNYTVSGIFTDLAATTSAGTYVSAGNKFTANNTIPTGIQTLYAQVTNSPTEPTCTFVVPFDFDNKKPTAVSVNKTVICPGGSVTLSGTCVSGTTPTWYTTATGGTSIGTGASLSQSPSSTTTYYIACEATNCVSGRVATNVVSISPLPTASASSNSPVCAGATLNLTGGAAGNTYLWTGPNTFTSTEQSPSITNTTTLATGTYRITVTNSTNCTSTATVAVTVNAIPTATASSNTPVCEGNSISLTGGGIGTYAWSGPNGFSSTEQNPTIASATVLATGTYTIVVTNPSNCTSTATTSVTVNGLATANVTPSTQTICSGEAITTIAISGTGTSYTWTRDNTGSVTGIAASGSGNISGSLTNTTEAPITVTFTITPVGTCNGTPITATVIVNPTPTATASTPSQSICSGASITGITFNLPPPFAPPALDPASDIEPKAITQKTQAIVLSSFVAGTVFNWTRDNTATVTGIAASGTGNISGTLTNTTTLPVTVTFTVTPSYTNAGKTCTGTPITVTVTVSPVVVATITDAGTAFCSGSSTTLSAPANPNYTYAWQRSLTGFANSFTTFGGTAQTQVVTTSGVYRVIVTNQFNCSASDTTAVKFGDFVYSGSLVAGDAQQTGRIFRDAAASTCASPKSYPGDFTTSGSRLYDSYTVTNPTNAPICATIGLTSGCGTNIFSVAYLGSYNPTSLGTNYLADHGSTFIGTAFYEATIPANGTMVVVVHEVNSGTGCSNYNLRIDVPGATVAPTASSNSPICAGNALNLTGTGTGTYSWTGPNSFTSTEQNPNIANATTLATGTYTINVTNTNGCVFSATTAVTVNALPTATATNNSPVCVGSTLNLSATGGVSYAWTGVNSFNSTQQNPSIASATSSAHGTYQVVVTNAAGCTAAATTSVIINGLPTATATSNSPVCAGNTVNLFGGGLSLPTLAPSGSYAWSGPNSFSSTLQNPNITSATVLATGTYQLIITNANGCTAMATTAVTVNALPTATATSNSPICAGNTINLMGGGLSAPALAPSGSYAWSGPNSFSSTLQNPSITSATTLATGTYQLIITNENGCTAMATTSVTVNDIPTATASNNSPICTGASLNFSAGGGISYAWTGVNSFSSTLQNPSILSATTSATGTYQVIVTNANGCTAMATTSATVNPTPTTPTPQANTQIIFGASITLTATGCSDVNDVLKWYKSADNTLATMPVSPTVTSNYYAKCETTLNGITCISPQSVDVTVTVLSPTPPVATGGTTCISTPLTLTATGCSGSTGTFELKWYQNADDALVTMPVSPTTTTQYYAKCEQTFNAVTAVSEKSNVVTLTVLTPAIPVATGATIYNGNSTTLTATGCTGEGFTVKWYQTSDNVLVTMPVSPTVTTQYYAKCEQTANSVTCISGKSNDVTVTVVNRIFVDITKLSAPIQNGLSWATAYGNLQTGLTAATAGVEVWVAKGTYKTTTTVNRNISFNIPNDVIVYGGFAGTENALSERNFRTNVSILSGEIGNTNDIADNSYHVVTFNGTSSNTVLNGFTITGGNASFNPSRTINLPITTVTSTVTNESGGGIALQNAAMPMITNCTISSNSSIFGGGLFAGDASKPTITFCKFMGNQATFGAGIYLQDGSHATISNTLISGNRGVGGLYNNYSNPTISNTTFSGNGGYNGGIFNSNSQPVMKNSIIWGNSTPFNDTQSIITYSIIQGGYAGTGNLNYDPQFVSQSPEGISPNLNGDYHLQASSLGVDRGDNGSISLTDLDLDGNLRRYNGGRVDMGAYEFQGNATASVVISIATGNWEINSTWDVNRVPQIGDIVIIDQNHIVTLNGVGNAKNIEYRGTGKLKFNSTSSKLNIGF